MKTPPLHTADDWAIDRAARLLAEGRLVAFPTETVYGLGADATSDMAVASIYAAKGRPQFNPLIVHVASAEQAKSFVQVDQRAALLMAAFWPGPLTLVLPRLAPCPISLLVSAGLDSIAIRMPDHPIALELLRRAGCPVAAPSANPSGAISPTTAQHVWQSLSGKVDIILDGGACRVGVESTVLDLTQESPVLLRPGGVAIEELTAVLGVKPLISQDDANAPKSPGQLGSHYAPHLPVRLNAVAPEPGEALLAFGPGFDDAALNLSPSGDLTEAAATLFASLRALDRPPYRAIAITAIPLHGLGAAINDRLTRAAAPRPGAPPSKGSP